MIKMPEINVCEVSFLIKLYIKTALNNWTNCKSISMDSSKCYLPYVVVQNFAPFCILWIPNVLLNVMQAPFVITVSTFVFFISVFSCGTVALYGLFINFFFLADHRATDFTLSKICGTPTKNTSHLSTVIFTKKRFVRAESCG